MRQIATIALVMTLAACGSQEEGDGLVLLSGDARAAGLRLEVDGVFEDAVLPLRVDREAEVRLVRGDDLSGVELVRVLDVLEGEILRIAGTAAVGERATLGHDVDPDALSIEADADRAYALGRSLGAEIEDEDDGRFRLSAPGLLEWATEAVEPAGVRDARPVKLAAIAGLASPPRARGSVAVARQRDWTGAESLAAQLLSLSSDQPADVAVSLRGRTRSLVDRLETLSRSGETAAGDAQLSDRACVRDMVLADAALRSTLAARAGREGAECDTMGMALFALSAIEDVTRSCVEPGAREARVMDLDADAGTLEMARERLAGARIARSFYDLEAAWGLSDEAGRLAADAHAPILEGDALIERGQVEFVRSDYTYARVSFERAAEVRKAAGDDAGLATATAWAGKMAHMLGDYEAALAAYRRALALDEQVLGAAHAKTVSARALLGETLVLQGAAAEGANVLEGVLRDHIASLGIDHPKVAQDREALGYALARSQRPDEALEQFEMAERAHQSAVGACHPSFFETWGGMAFVHFGEGRFQEAYTFGERGNALVEAAIGPEHAELAIGYGNAAMALARMGRHGEARERWQLAQDMEQRLFGRNRSRYGWSQITP